MGKKNTVVLEQLNSVRLRGIIGSVRTFDTQDSSDIIFTVATNYAYPLDGETVIETTWHRVVWRGKKDDRPSLEKGQGIEVQGRLRNRPIATSDGEIHTSVEVCASEVRIIEENLIMQTEL